jgi:hypothetical protein
MRTLFFIQMEWPNGVGHPTNPGGTHWEIIMETTGREWKQHLDACKAADPDEKFRAIRRDVMPDEVMA